MTEYEYMSRDTLVAELKQAKADFHGAMGSVIVAEAVAKEEVEKRKTLEDQLVKCQQIKDDNEGMAETWMKSFDRVQKKIEAVEAWIEERVENDELTDEIKELAEAVDYELMEEVEITLTMSMVVTVKKPVGTDVDDTDFWTFSNDWIESTYEIVSTEDLSVDCAE